MKLFPYEQFSDNAKMIYISFISALGKKYKKFALGFMTTSLENVLSTLIKDPISVSINKHHEMKFITSQKHQRLDYTMTYAPSTVKFMVVRWWPY